MNQIKLWLFKTREYIAKNYLVSIQALYYNKKVLYFQNYLFILRIILSLLPFQWVSSCLAYYDIGIIYKLDSIYNITNVKQTYILPMIFNFDFVSNFSTDTKTIYARNFLSNIKYYNASLPLSYIIDTNDLSTYHQIKLKYISKAKFYDKIIDIDAYRSFLLYELFID
jgi:hypothetical protein